MVRRHQPDVVIPEIEALAVSALAELEQDGITIIPTARATAVTMNRDRIRDLAAGELALRTARFAYAASAEELADVAPALGLAGGGQTRDELVRQRQSVVDAPEGLAAAWTTAMDGAGAPHRG